LGKPLLVLAVIGQKNTGKTRVIEHLVRGLRRRGLKVSTMKHVPEEGFSLDKPGKDSWRHAEAGALSVTLVAPREVSTIRRVGVGDLRFEDLVALAAEGCDVLIMEGFSSLVRDRPEVLKVITVPSPEEALRIEEEGSVRPVLAFVGPGGKPEGLRAAYVDREDLDPLLSTIEGLISRLREVRRGGLRLVVKGKEVPLNPFIRGLFRKLILAFITSLKGVEVKEDEEVEVVVS